MVHDLTELLEQTAELPDDAPDGGALVRRGRRRRTRRRATLVAAPVVAILAAVTFLAPSPPAIPDIADRPPSAGPSGDAVVTDQETFRDPGFGQLDPDGAVVDVTAVPYEPSPLGPPPAVRVPGAYPSGRVSREVAVGHDGVWLPEPILDDDGSTTGRSLVTRVRAQGRHLVLAQIEIDRDAWVIATTTDAVWIGGPGGLTRIDPTTDEVDLEVDLGIEVSFLVDTPTGFWAATGAPDDPTIRRIDPATGEVLVATDLDLGVDTGVGGVAVIPTAVLVTTTTSDELLRFDLPGPDDEVLIASNRLPLQGQGVLPVAGAGVAWLVDLGRTQRPSLLRVDTTGRLQTTGRWGLGGLPGRVALLGDGGPVVTTDRGEVLHLQPPLVLEFVGEAQPADPVADEGLVLTPVVATDDLGQGAVGLAVDGERLWLVGGDRLGVADVLSFADLTGAGATLPDPCRVDKGTADVDGDGRDDVLAADTATNELVVCFADGSRQRMPWPAMFEVLRTGDVDGDGMAEVFPGATLESATGVEVGRLVDGELVTVVTEDGDPLRLIDGTLGLHSGNETRHTWGCADLLVVEDGDEPLGRGLVSVVATVESVADDGTWTWSVTTTRYVLDSDTARVAAAIGGRTTTDGEPFNQDILDPDLPAPQPC